MDIPARELAADVIYQIGALDGLARVAGTAVRYVKPHGALYNTIAQGGDQARAVIDAMLAYDPALPLMALAGSPIVTLARDAGLPVITEAFADRGYQPDGQLVSRRAAGAVLHDPEEIAQRMLRFAREGVIRAVDGQDVRVEAQSICVHGDSPGAVAMARRIRQVFDDAGIPLTPFTTANP